MVAKASTHRLEPDVQAALDHLSKALRHPKNRLINEAVKLYVRQRGREVEKELELTLEALRTCRRNDPDFDASIDAFVNAEVQSATKDPAEGSPRSRKKSVQSEIRGLLHA